MSEFTGYVILILIAFAIFGLAWFEDYCDKYYSNNTKDCFCDNEIRLVITIKHEKES